MFDVESLFTNVPIDAAVQAAMQKLENDPSLADRSKLTPAQITDLLTFVLRSTYFQYNGSIYEQKDCAAMSPVSAVIASLFMESFEEQAITTSSYEPRIWSVHRKPTHTDQYLAYDSHHPQSVKRSIVKCLYECAKRLVTKPSVISEEKKHLSSVPVFNGYPFFFLAETYQDRKIK